MVQSRRGSDLEGLGVAGGRGAEVGKAPVVVEGGAAAVQLDGPREAHHRLPELPLRAMREGGRWRGGGQRAVHKGE